MTAFAFAGKVALVTGSSRGIGKAIVIELAKLGCSVVIHYNSRKDEAVQVKSIVDGIIQANGPQLAQHQKSLIVQANVGSSKDVARSIDETRLVFPSGIDYLICSAGVILYKPTLTISESEMDTLLDTNVKGTILFNQGVFSTSIFDKGSNNANERLIKSGGVILNISSSATALNPIPHVYALYVASKGAVEQFSKAFAQEIGRAPYHVRLNVISPGK